MGLKLITDDKGTKIYRKDKVSKAGNPYTTYSTMVSSKNMDGSYTSTFQEVFFKKGVSVNNKAVIKINNAFPTVNEYNDVKTIRYMILDFEVIENGEEPTSTPEPTGNEAFMDLSGIDESEMPFM